MVNTIKVAQILLILHPDARLTFGWSSSTRLHISTAMQTLTCSWLTGRVSQRVFEYTAPNKSAIWQTTGSFLFESQILGAASKHYHAGRILGEDGGEHFKNLPSLCFSRRADWMPESFSRPFSCSLMQSAWRPFSSFYAFFEKKTTTSHCSHRPAA